MAAATPGILASTANEATSNIVSVSSPALDTTPLYFGSGVSVGMIGGAVLAKQATARGWGPTVTFPVILPNEPLMTVTELSAGDVIRAVCPVLP
jgi:hypothetical protein